jgi:hypothetical protein
MTKGHFHTILDTAKRITASAERAIC